MLRERGAFDAAEDLRRGELAAALARARVTVETDGALEERLNAIFARESERVADAAVLAELLAPMLSHAAVPAAHTIPATDAHAEEPSSPAANFEPLPSSPSHRDPADIAQFIDDMIAQERPPAPGPRVRRAS